MTAPLVHVYSVDVKEDKGAVFEKYPEEHVEFVETNHSDLLAFHLFLRDDARVSFVQIHPDAHSMDIFMERIVPTYGKEAMQYYRQGTMGSDIYGLLSETATKHMREFGIDLHLNPRHLGGFTRLTD